MNERAEVAQASDPAAAEVASCVGHALMPGALRLGGRRRSCTGGPCFLRIRRTSAYVGAGPVVGVEASCCPACWRCTLLRCSWHRCFFTSWYAAGCVPQHIVIAKQQLLISRDGWQRSQSRNALGDTQRRLARCGAVLVPLCANSVWERGQADSGVRFTGGRNSMTTSIGHTMPYCVPASPPQPCQCSSWVNLGPSGVPEPCLLCTPARDTGFPAAGSSTSSTSSCRDKQLDLCRHRSPPRRPVLRPQLSSTVPSLKLPLRFTLCVFEPLGRLLTPCI
jgi:hypothetical protein